jgi:hypothetical protein
MFEEVRGAGMDAQGWCEQIRQQLMRHGTFVCLREGVDPATAQPEAR